ncbi:MAG: ROK family protein [Niabella sp.]|nr:ROK family protein [Niabella sp.]
MFDKDPRTVLTLDAGGTNLVFSAIRENTEVTPPLTLPADTQDLKNCLNTIVSGFEQVKKRIEGEPVAISFAFPGPADYENGIIGDLPNFPCFRGGVALGPFLKMKFGLPVFINNDGHLFAYGEALAGALPQINRELKESGSRRQFKNLIAVTIGTGFGGGIVINNRLLFGDNGSAANLWSMANKRDGSQIAEAGISVRAVQKEYAQQSGTKVSLSPREIFEIAEGSRTGDQLAAINAFNELGTMAGFTLAETLNVADGLVVIGGGIANAHKYLLPAIIAEINGRRTLIDGEQVPCLPAQAYNLMDQEQKNEFLIDAAKKIMIPGSEKSIEYACGKKTGIVISSLGTSRAVALGAYAFALTKLDINN